RAARRRRDARLRAGGRSRQRAGLPRRTHHRGTHGEPRRRLHDGRPSALDDPSPAGCGRARRGGNPRGPHPGVGRYRGSRRPGARVRGRPGSRPRGAAVTSLTLARRPVAFGPASLVGSIWALLTNVRFAVFQISLIVVSGLIGTLVRQIPSFALHDYGAYQRELQDLHARYDGASLLGWQFGPSMVDV